MEVGAFEAIKNAFGFIAATIALLRQAKDLLPEGAEKEVVEQSLKAWRKRRGTLSWLRHRSLKPFATKYVDVLSHRRSC